MGNEECKEATPGRGLADAEAAAAAAAVATTAAASAAADVAAFDAAPARRSSPSPPPRRPVCLRHRDRSGRHSRRRTAAEPPPVAAVNAVAPSATPTAAAVDADAESVGGAWEGGRVRWEGRGRLPGGVCVCVVAGVVEGSIQHH